MKGTTESKRRREEPGQSFPKDGVPEELNRLTGSRAQAGPNPERFVSKQPWPPSQDTGLFFSVKVLLGYIPSSKVGSEPDLRAAFAPWPKATGPHQVHLGLPCPIQAHDRARQYSQSTSKWLKTSSSRGIQRHNYTHQNTHSTMHKEKAEIRYTQKPLITALLQILLSNNLEIN